MLINDSLTKRKRLRIFFHDPVVPPSRIGMPKLISTSNAERLLNASQNIAFTQRRHVPLSYHITICLPRAARGWTRSSMGLR